MVETSFCNIVQLEIMVGVRTAWATCAHSHTSKYSLCCEWDSFLQARNEDLILFVKRDMNSFVCASEWGSSACKTPKGEFSPSWAVVIPCNSDRIYYLLSLQIQTLHIFFLQLSIFIQDYFPQMCLCSVSSVESCFVNFFFPQISELP
jgi:hypothetical protein